MSGHWSGLQSVVAHINAAENPAAEMAACMEFMLATVKLDTSDMSDAVQEAFLAHEAFLEK